MTCIMVAAAQNPGNAIPTYCFDAESHLRLVNAPETAFQLDDYQVFQNRAVAKDLKVSSNKHLASTIKVVLLEPLSPADAASVKPPSNAVSQPCSRVPGDPKLVVVKQSGAMYPMKAAEQRALGTVYVNVMILKTGKVKIKGANGSPYLTQAASDAIQDWKFQPYMIGGQAVDVEAVIPYTFDGKSFVPWPGGVEPNPSCRSTGRLGKRGSTLWQQANQRGPSHRKNPAFVFESQLLAPHFISRDTVHRTPACSRFRRRSPT